MSVTDRTQFPAIRAISCKAGSNDGINVEDLLYRARKKPNQKTYRNRHINTVEQEPRDLEAPQHLDVKDKGGELVSVEKKAAPKKQISKRAPRKTLTLVKDIGVSSGSHEVCPSSFCVIKHDTDHSLQLRKYSDIATDPIETQALRRFRKTPRTNETRRRYSLSQLRQTVKLPTHETIDLKEFKFPQAPQTPRARRYLNWTPGSGFDGIQLSSPSVLTKRFRRRTYVSSSRSSRNRLADPPKGKAVGDGSSNAYRRERDVVKKRLFAGGSSYNTAISTRYLVGESEQPAEEVVEDEQWPPLCKTGQLEVQKGEGHALAEEVQNHQEAFIGQTLAEEPRGRSSLRECYQNNAKASCRDAEPSHTVLDVPPGSATDSHTANRTQGVAIESEPNASAISPHSAYVHLPSSALQDPSIHDTHEAIPTSTLNEIAYFPYHAYLHPPSSSLQEAATSGAKQSGIEVEIADQDTDKEAESRQNSSYESTSNEEDRESMLGDNEVLEIADQDPDKETESRQGISSEGTSDEEDCESMHEENQEPEIADQNTDSEPGSSQGGSSKRTSNEEDCETMLEKDDEMNSRHSTADEPYDEDMLDVVEERQHPAQHTPPTQSGIPKTPPRRKSSKRLRMTHGEQVHQALRYWQPRLL